MSLLAETRQIGGSETDLLAHYDQLIAAEWVAPEESFLLTDRMRQLLSRYLVLLNRWNRVHSLTAITDPLEQVRRHIVDALLVWPHLVRRLASVAHPRIADVGTGMGVPGIVWAIVMPRAAFDLYERQQKKLAFLRHVVGQLELAASVRVMPGDVRHARPDADVDVISSRAFAALAEFVAATRSIAGRKTVWAAMIGRLDPEICKHSLLKIDTSGEDFMIDDVVVLKAPTLAASRHLVWVRRVS